MRNLSIKSFENYPSSKWDKLITDFDVTINYTAWFISYIEVLNSNNNIKNLSFLLLEDDEIVAIVPLYVEEINGKCQISMGQEPIYAPIVRTDADASSSLVYCKFILNEIEDISRKFKCTLARFHFSPLLTENMIPNFFIEFGYKEDIQHPDWYIFKSKNSYIINLNNEENDLYSEVRKSNKPHINRTRKETDLVILDGNNFDQSIFDQYIQFYYAVKGNKRSQSAFELDKSAIKTLSITEIGVGDKADNILQQDASVPQIAIPPKVHEKEPKKDHSQLHDSFHGYHEQPHANTFLPRALENLNDSRIFSRYDRIISKRKDYHRPTSA